MHPCFTHPLPSQGNQTWVRFFSNLYLSKLKYYEIWSDHCIFTHTWSCHKKDASRAPHSLNKSFFSVSGMSFAEGAVNISISIVLILHGYPICSSITSGQIDSQVQVYFLSNFPGVWENILKINLVVIASFVNM